MIGRTHRFHGRAGIRRLLATGQAVRGRSLALKYAPNPKRGSYRLAVVVSRKVSKSAVTRNRIRRRLYERVRILSGSFSAPYDLVLLAYDEQLASLPPAHLEAEVDKLLQKAKVSGRQTPAHDIVEQ